MFIRKRVPYQLGKVDVTYLQVMLLLRGVRQQHASQIFEYEKLGCTNISIEDRLLHAKWATALFIPNGLSVCKAAEV